MKTVIPLDDLGSLNVDENPTIRYAVTPVESAINDGAETPVKTLQPGFDTPQEIEGVTVVAKVPDKWAYIIGFIALCVSGITSILYINKKR